MRPRKAYRLEWGRHALELGRRTCIMGVLNVTPDSFSDGGLFLDPATAVAQGERLAAEGADIIDIGGESTRPFSEPVTVEEETRRVVPVIAELARRVSTPISIDTTKSVVARRALAAGAAMVNDISALRCDPAVAAVAAEFGVPLCLMHMLGEPRTMQVSPSYDDLVGEIRDFLKDAAAAAEAQGVPRPMLIADPGIGFGKTPAHNLQLIHRLAEFAALDMPILIGPSRKSFIRRLVAKTGETDIAPDAPMVAIGTQATVAAAAAEFGVPLCLMHMQGEPRTMQVAPVYDDLVGEIRDFLQAAAAAAEAQGVPRSMLIADPGIGFGKTPAHNLQLIHHLAEFAVLDMPILVGPSRKSFIRRLVAKTGETDIAPDAPMVAIGTQAAVAAAILNGAHIVRVHDVADTVATCKVVDAIVNA